MTYPSNSDGMVTRETLLGFVERIESVFVEIDSLNESKRDIYGEADEAGIEKTALGKVVSYRRRRNKNPEAFDQQDTMVRYYLDLLDGSLESVEPHARIRAREAVEQERSRADFFARLDAERADGKSKDRKVFVYFLSAEEAGVVKIGVTDDLDRRIGSITRMSPLPLELLLAIPGDHKVESQMHERFKAQRLHGEWFSTTDGKILEFIAAYVPHDPETGEITDPVANVEEGANGAIAAASVDPASREDDGADRQQPATSGFAGDGEVASAASPAINLVPAAKARPWCLKPSSCAGQGKQHCYSCMKAHADAEGFAA